MEQKTDKTPFWYHLVAWLIFEPICFIHGIIFDLGIWYHNADWLHPIRTRRQNRWKTVWEGWLAAVERLIAHETDKESSAYGQAYLALRLTFSNGIKILIDRYGPPTSSVPRELQPGRRIAVRRNGLGEYRFDQVA